MKNFFRIPGKLLLIVIMITLLVTSCSLLPTSISDTARDTLYGGGDTVTISREEYERLQRYAEMDQMLAIVEEYYYQEPNIEAMIENAGRGLLYGLEDPYSFYYNPEQFAEMWEEDEGEYAGIGIQIMGSYETYLCTITRVFANSPAFDAGLRKGDILIQVEDVMVDAYTMQDAVNIMRGEVGKTVHLSVQRNDETLEFDIPRAVVHINWVSGTVLDGEIGYIALYEFSGDCAQRFMDELNVLLSQNIKGLIIDLRDNPGGWVEAAITLSDIFLPAGIITYTELRDGSREFYSSTEGALDIPLVVMINENSASASEIMAGALQDRDRATIVGTKSFGKGVMQYVLPVGSEGAGMQLTISQYFTPSGKVVHKEGIHPDVEISIPEDDTTLYEVGDLNDPQLKVAHEEALKLTK